MDIKLLLFSPHGRINRKHFLVGLLTLMALSIALSYALSIVMGIGAAELQVIPRLPRVIGRDLMVNLILFWPGFCVIAKRLHDRNRPALLAGLFYLLLSLVSVLEYFRFLGAGITPSIPATLIGLAMLGVLAWLLIEMLFLPGTRGNNPYGPDPLGNDAAQEI